MRWEAGKMPALDGESNLDAIVGRPFVVAGVERRARCPPYKWLKINKKMVWVVSNQIVKYCKIL
jgi:hypothetical protein